MDSTTACSSPPSADHLIDDLGWTALIRHLPDETVLQAHHLGAFRRVRVIPSPMVLLRIILVYAVVADMTFRALSDWCVGQYALSLSHVALRKRCRAAHCWLAWLVRTLLVSPERADTGLHVELIDATVVVSPRPVGPLKVRHQWRIHLGMDLATLQLTMCDVMPVVGHPSSESLDRIAADPHTLFLGDRAYATVRGLTPHLRAGSQVLVRCPWKNLRLLHADGQRVDLHAWLQETGPTPIAECQVHLPLGRHEHYPMRVVRYALPPEEAAAARKRVKTAKTLPETLFAAGYVLLLTNLPTDRWSAEDILALYRYRWQIEIRIKRLKQVSTLSAIRCGDPAIALTILYAHLVVALLVEHATTQLQDEVPWWWIDQEYPANTWRIDAGIHARIVQQIRGWRWCLAAIEDTPAYRRIFCDTPSTRTLQSVSARHLPDHFPVSSP